MTNVMIIISHIHSVPVSTLKKRYTVKSSQHWAFLACDCHDEGTISCDKQTGICNCKSNFKGHRCDVCAAGYFGPDCQSKPKIFSFSLKPMV